MTIDRYTKSIMTVIAVALVMIALNPWIAPTKAYAELEPYDLSTIEAHVLQIANGLCLNQKICGN